MFRLLPFLPLRMDYDSQRTYSVTSEQEFEGMDTESEIIVYQPMEDPLTEYENAQCAMDPWTEYEDSQRTQYFFQTKPKIKKTVCAQPFGVFPEEMWCFGILLFCDLPSLLRLNWTCTGLRRVLNNPFYVQWWQSHAWFLKASGCGCARGVFYLNLRRFPDFVYDCKGLKTLRDMEVAMRSVGRSMDMYVDPLRDVHGVPWLDPNRRPECFTGGLLHCWLSYLLIPMPRMLPCPIEDAHDPSRMPVLWRTSLRFPEEDVQEYQERRFWGAFHSVPEVGEDPHAAETVIVAEDWSPNGPEAEVSGADDTDTEASEASPVRGASSLEPLPPTITTVWPAHQGPEKQNQPLSPGTWAPVNGFGDVPSPDLVVDWKHRCECEGADYLDPAYDDAAAHGSAAVRWARHLLYDTPVGVQSYPHTLCVRRSQLCGRAYRDGVDYIEHLYLPARRTASTSTAYEPDEVRLMMHKGLAYFHPIRYENERGDFCNWVLSTIAVMQSVQQYLWYDSVNVVIRRVVECAAELAMEVQNDMSPSRLAQRWGELQRSCFFNEATWPPVPDTPQAERQRMRNAKALDLIFHHTFVENNRHMSRYVEAIHHGSAIASTRGYLLSLVPESGRMHAGQRSEQTLYRELNDAIRTLVYVTLFATSVGPMTDHLTEQRRYQQMSSWLGCTASLLLFAPSWERPLTWTPSATGTSASCRVPHIVLEHNHRFQDLLLFLNRRTLYYHPEPHIYQLWQNRNLEVGRPL